MSKRVKQAVVVAGVLVASSHSWSEELANRPRVRPLAGVSIGLPAVVNGVIGVEAQHVGVRISGAYWGHDINGVETELSAPFYKTARQRASVNAVFGTNRFELEFDTSGPLEVSTYAGVGARVEWRGLFFSSGPCYRLNTDNAPSGSRFIWRLVFGYVFAFGG